MKRKMLLIDEDDMLIVDSLKVATGTFHVVYRS